MIKNLLSLIDKYELDASILDDIKGSCFSGSTVLQAIISEDWFDDYSDLDIYVPEGYENVIFDRLKKIGYEQRIRIHSDADSIMEVYGPMSTVTFWKYSSKYMDKFKYTRCEVPPRSQVLKIDVVLVKDMSVQEFINGFDLDICRNSFDGKQLKIKNLQGIKDRVATYYDHGQENKGRRINKYVERGFKINTVINK